jgi:predicted SnoaL-like aldol condensation-catalyzing enzyme
MSDATGGNTASVALVLDSLRRGQPAGAAGRTAGDQADAVVRDVHRVLGAGDLVVTHSTIPGPDGPSAVAFDLWRVADGAIAERWGDSEPWADETANGHTQIDGLTTIDRNADTAATASVIEQTVRTILVENDFSDLERYLAGDDYVQHNPRFADGVSGLAAALGELAKQGITMQYSEITHVVADGDFAYTRSLGRFGDAAFVFHDLFRVSDGLVVEHWDVIAAVGE